MNAATTNQTDTRPGGGNGVAAGAGGPEPLGFAVRGKAYQPGRAGSTIRAGIGTPAAGAGWAWIVGGSFRSQHC